ncbi:unnamed protein product [marine sediment metagenome]|uniref:Homing endonuclease LAGLIDADG domain-containing protein n=1 Tax=marine sediment metagenome TaxID=412755 RepID=X1JMB2_9ZZZZ
MPRGKNQFREWTADDVKFLREHYLQLPLYEIAKIINKSYRGIQAKAQRLRLYQETTENMKPLQNLTEMEKAYIAGFFDGEGYFGVRTIYKNDRPVHAKSTINIGNTNKEIIYWLASKINFGKWKTKTPYIYHPKSQKASTAYTLSICGCFRVEPFLKAILPYLRIKKDLVIKLLELYEIHPRQTSYTLPIWKKILEIKILINSKKGTSIESRNRIAEFVKELEAAAKDPKDI